MKFIYLGSLGIHNLPGFWNSNYFRDLDITTDIRIYLIRSIFFAFAAVNPLLLSQAMFDDDDFLGKKNKNKRGVLPKQATQVMKSWLFQHIVVSCMLEKFIV